MTLGTAGRKLIKGAVEPTSDVTHFTTRRKVVVFGLAGTGKSSMINAITGSNLKTGNGVLGVTDAYTRIERSYPTDT